MVAALTLGVGIQGYFKLEAFKGQQIFDANGDWHGDVIEYPGTRRQLTQWMPNQILDAGRNIMATSANWAGAGSKCQVGTGSTAPGPTETQLETFLAGTAVIAAASSGAQSSAPYYGWDRQTYRFAVGTATGNISEAGVGWSASDGPFLISRALIVDGGGSPTTVTVLSDELLDVTYELRYLAPTSDVLGTVTLDGVVYDTISRAAQVTAWGGDIGQILGQKSLVSSDWQAYDGNLGTVTQAPSGLFQPCDNADQANLSYSNNSYQIDMQCDCGGTGWNLAAGIRSIRITTNAGLFQTQFNAQSDGSRIPKTTSFTMSFVWRLAWAAAVLP